MKTDKTEKLDEMMKKKTLLQRLVRCTLGENSTVIGLVATGIALSGAAYYGSKTNANISRAADKIGTRIGQGSAGTAPLPGQ